MRKDKITAPVRIDVKTFVIPSLRMVSVIKENRNPTTVSSSGLIIVDGPIGTMTECMNEKM